MLQDEVTSHTSLRKGMLGTLCPFGSFLLGEHEPGHIFRHQNYPDDFSSPVFNNEY